MLLFKDLKIKLKWIRCGGAIAIIFFCWRVVQTFNFSRQKHQTIPILKEKKKKTKKKHSHGYDGEVYIRGVISSSLTTKKGGVCICVRRMWAYVNVSAQACVSSKSDRRTYSKTERNTHHNAHTPHHLFFSMHKLQLKIIIF